MMPTPAERLSERIAHWPPDACRDLLALLDRAQAAGGGDALIRLIVDADGTVDVELPRRYSRRALDAKEA